MQESKECKFGYSDFYAEGDRRVQFTSIEGASEVEAQKLASRHFNELAEQHGTMIQWFRCRSWAPEIKYTKDCRLAVAV